MNEVRQNALVEEIQLLPTLNNILDLNRAIEFYTRKIDNEETNGLDGVHDSLAYRVHEIETHFHSNERWMGAAAVPSGEVHVADEDSMTAFQIDAGNDTWGSWLQIMGSDDTPIQTGKKYIDMHRIMVTDVERKKAITRIQFAGGDSGAAGFAAGNYTELLATPDNDGKQDPYEIQMPRFPSGTKGWARCWVKAADTGTIDFFIGLHEYEG